MDRADSPHYDTMRQILEAAFMGDPFASVYLELADHCLLFEPDESPETSYGPLLTTKYGGAADLPAGYVPPVMEGRRIWLMAQVDLSPFPQISSRWFGAESGVFYLFGRGKPEEYETVIPMRRDFDLVADFWSPAAGEERAEITRSSLVEAYLPEVKLRPVLGVSFPSWKFLDEYLDEGPPEQTRIIQAFFEKHGYTTDFQLFDDIDMERILGDMRKAGIPVDLDRHSLAMFTCPKSLSQGLGSIVPYEEWLLGRWPRLVRIFDQRSLYVYQSVGLPAGVRRLDSAELYAAADPSGIVDFSQQRCAVRWIP